MKPSRGKNILKTLKTNSGDTINERRAITYFNFNFKSSSGQAVPIDYYKDFCFF